MNYKPAGTELSMDDVARDLGVSITTGFPCAVGKRANQRSHKEKGTGIYRKNAVQPE